MKSSFLILSLLLFCPIMSQTVWSQETRTGYVTIWVKHNDNTSERIVLCEKYNGNLQVGDVEYTQFVVEYGKASYYWRMDGKKMMRYDVNNGEEYVIYDFGLNVGDLFEAPDGRTLQIVEKGDTVFGEDMPTFHFQKVINKDNPDDTDVWIENYGSLSTSILMRSELGDDVLDSHLLFDRSGPLTNVFRSEYIQSQMMDVEKETRYNYEAYYDEVSGKMKGDGDSLVCEFKADTLVISGRVRRYGSEPARHYMTCEKVGDVIRFRVDGFPAFTNSYRNIFFTAKFPGFKPGKYTVNYDDELLGVDKVINIKVDNPSPTYSTVPYSMWENDYGEKTWVLKNIYTDANGKRTVSTHYITNYYSENVKAGGWDCVDLMEPAEDESGSIYFKHHVFWDFSGRVYKYYEDYNALYKFFDFGLEPGQQLERFDYSKYEVTDCGVASDYAPYWSAYCQNRRMLLMHRLDAEGDDVWIEGVGSVHFGLFEPSDFNSSEVYVQSVFHGVNDCAFFSIDTDVFKSVPFEAELLETADPAVEEILMDQSNYNTTFDMEFIGDTLHVNWQIDGGKADVMIAMKDEVPIYRADKCKKGENADFELLIPKTGEYTTTISARHARGVD